MIPAIDMEGDAIAVVENHLPRMPGEGDGPALNEHEERAVDLLIEILGGSRGISPAKIQSFVHEVALASRGPLDIRKPKGEDTFYDA